MNGKRNFEITWPLHGERSSNPLPADPQREVADYAPLKQTLAELPDRTDIPAEPSSASRKSRPSGLRDTLPPGAPEWMRAARTLADGLEAMISRGDATAIEHAAVARAWAAWSLGGVDERQILRVAHVVSRAHQAIRNTSPNRRGLQAALHAAAGVLHSNLPMAIGTRLPLERVVYVMRMLHSEADPWVAVVEGTADILGWKHYARVHAASVIRAVLEHRDDYD